jgi:type IV fimbrial biogenesis protein FimT
MTVYRELAAAGRQKEVGFTLVELLTVVTIVAVLGLLATPFLSNAGLNGTLTASANNLVAAVNMARTEAVKRNATITLCMSADGTSCAASGNWAQGWIVKNGSTVLYYQSSAPTGFKISDSGSAITISFPPYGLLSASYTFTLCRQTPTVGSQERTVYVSTTGQLRVKTTSTGLCP